MESGRRLPLKVGESDRIKRVVHKRLHLPRPKQVQHLGERVLKQARPCAGVDGGRLAREQLMPCFGRVVLATRSACGERLCAAIATPVDDCIHLRAQRRGAGSRQ